MSGLDIFALIVLLVLLAVIMVVFVLLGLWPGKAAKQRQHPQVDAITIGSWVGLLAGGVLWPLVLIWAYTQPLSRNSQASKDATDIGLTERVKQLENQLAELKAHDSKNGGTA